MSLNVNFYFHAHLAEAKTLDVLTANVVENVAQQMAARCNPWLDIAPISPNLDASFEGGRRVRFENFTHTVSNR